MLFPFWQSTCMINRRKIFFLCFSSTKSPKYPIFLCLENLAQSVALWWFQFVNLGGKTASLVLSVKSVPSFSLHSKNRINNWMGGGFFNHLITVYLHQWAVEHRPHECSAFIRHSYIPHLSPWHFSGTLLQYAMRTMQMFAIIPGEGGSIWERLRPVS